MIWVSRVGENELGAAKKEWVGGSERDVPCDI